MDLQFSSELAEKFGVDEAIFVQSIGFWLRKNRANDVNFEDGHYWTYNTRKAMQQLFPFWSQRQLDRIAASCQDKGLLIIKHPEGSTRRGWYTLTDQSAGMLGLDLSQNAESLSRNGDNLSPNRYNLSPNGDNALNLNKQNNTKENMRAKARKIFFDAVGEDEGLRKLVDKYLAMRWEIKKPFKSENGPNGAVRRLLKFSGGDTGAMAKLLQNAIDNEWLTFYALKGDERPADYGADDFELPSGEQEVSTW